MIIISKYKDCYDYLISKYGRDNKIILDRREGYIRKFNEYSTLDMIEYEQLAIAIGGTRYNGTRDIIKDKIYWGEECLQLGEEIQYSRRRPQSKQVKIIGKNQSYVFSYKSYPTTINDKENCPIIELHKSHCNHYPRLTEFKITSVIDLDTIYQTVYNWLSKQLDVDYSNTQTDKEKIISKGFDIKKSFRHRK